jgi:type IV pilus modification protein PilV
MPKIKTATAKGFSLIEALIAIAILIVGVLSAFLLLIRTTATIPAMQNRLMATNLAQEGVELVRALRDTDFVAGNQFKDFLSAIDCQTTDSCQIAANAYGKIELLPNGAKPLFYNSNTHLYNYDNSFNSEPSNFFRLITIDRTAIDYLVVTVRVIYQVKGVDKEISVTDYLYNWLAP